MLHHSHASHASCDNHSVSSNNIGRLSLVLAITTLYMVVEFLGGLWANSLALLADAGHMLADVGAITLALFAAWFAEQPASSQKTYGYYRLEIVAAFVNGIILAIMAAYIIYEAYERFKNPPQVEGALLMAIAAGGFVINLIAAAILFSPGQRNINVRGAFIHVVSDSLGSLGAVLAGASVMYFGFVQADAIFSVLIAVLVLVNGWKLIQEAVNILLEACPAHLNVAQIRQALTALPEVQSVHDLHVWCITSGKDAMSVHVVVEDPNHYTPELVTKIQHTLKDRFGLTHITIQLEPPDFEEDEIHF